MGMFKVGVTVANPVDPERSFAEEFWVDTGALYSFVPGPRLEEIGLMPVRTRDLIMADGRRDQRLLGEAFFSLNGFEERLTCPVIFGPPDSLYLLGATALEIFGVDVDPTQRKLKPILGIIGGFEASR
jgi:predicted aspartyl protease